jgi:hypothetical protein
VVSHRDEALLAGEGTVTKPLLPGSEDAVDLIENHMFETPDGRRYVAGYLKGDWGLRPHPTTTADLGSCADYAARVRAACALVSDILWVEEGTGQLRRLILCPPPLGPVQRLIGRSQNVATEPEASWEPTAWTVADLIHRGPRPA